jgi:hypothetical protein
MLQKMFLIIFLLDSVQLELQSPIFDYVALALTVDQGAFLLLIHGFGSRRRRSVICVCHLILTLL